VQPTKVSIKAHTLAVSPQANLPALAEQRADATGPVADVLRQYQLGFLTLKTEQVAAKANTDADIETARKDKAAVQKKLDETKWHHFWKWEIWSSFKSNCRNAIAAHEADITSLTATSIAQQAEIDKLQSDADTKHAAAETSEGLESASQSLAQQISAFEQTKTRTETQYTADRDQFKNEGDDVVQGFIDTAANKTKLMGTAQAELDSLVDSTHALSKDLQEVTATLTKVIDDTQIDIENLAGDITQTETSKVEKQSEKAQSIAQYDAELKSLDEQKTTPETGLDAQQATAEANEKAAQEALAARTSKGEEEVQSLKDLLSGSITSLGKEHATATSDRSSTIASNAAAMKATIDLHNDKVTELQAKQQVNQSQTKQDGDARVKTFTDLIANLTTSIDDAQAELDSLTASAAAADFKQASFVQKSEFKQPATADTGATADDATAATGATAATTATAATADDAKDGAPDGVGTAPTHTLVQQIESAKAAIAATIAMHQQTIAGLKAAIVTNQEQTKKEQDAKEASIFAFDEDIKALEDQKSVLAANKVSAESTKQATEDDLAEKKEAKEATIEELKTSLTTTIAGLLSEKNAADASRVSTGTANALSMQTLKNSQDQEITRLDSEIATLTASLQDATVTLNTIKSDHGVN